MAELAYIGLGANLAQPARQLRLALHALAALPGSKLLGASSLYHSAPMGPQDQPDYVNAVAALETELEPLALLDALQAIERQQGRVRKRRWGERTLDLDLLLYAGREIDHPRLTLPHPGLTQRPFVLAPLCELAPALTLPGGGCPHRHLAELPAGGLRRAGPAL
ncbi:2-amino-4-hydroxy-6-hydroxymethyldihydropteridine diphosphokinase [Gallaecimonas sp. GXIMD4217]|uniref:2-amino-4-hydroxy-6- hydroxymethyldihydropteridine diphosphokinase n=1 Tax=Gallaecimonas sp. GXIMD4217 TaxID=3131927 RepID=UPI00311B2904